jgi:hypothetical protein
VYILYFVSMKDLTFDFNLWESQCRPWNLHDSSSYLRGQ